MLLRTWRLPSWLVPASEKVTLKDQAHLHNQLAILLHRGVPLVESLEVTASVVTPKTRPLVERMRERVAAGASFSDACRESRVFDAVTIAVYESAERTGDLAGAAKQLSSTAKRQQAMRDKASVLLAYPLIVLSISVVVTLVMLIGIVPQIADALQGLPNVTLPTYTQVVLAVSAFMKANAFLVIGVVIGLVVLGIVMRREVGGVIAGFARRLPMLKDLLLAQENARFFTVMAAMARGGIPLADALGVATGALHDPALMKQVRRLRQKLIDGGVLSRLIDGVSAWPLATRRLLIAADRAGDLETAFDGLSEDLAAEVETKTQRLLAVLEPMLIVGMFLVIGSILLSILIPLLTLPNQMEF